MTVVKKQIQTLYRYPLKSKRSGALYSAFSYPTKISPEAIALFIAAHTKPGDTVFDGFGGSCSTAIGAMLCSNPTSELKRTAERMGLHVNWGVRNAVVYELSSLGAFVGEVMCHPPDADEFTEAAEQLLNKVEKEVARFYEAKDPNGKVGELRYAVWSEVLVCPECKKRSTFWEGCARVNPARIESDFHCGHCGAISWSADLRRVTAKKHDPLLQKKVEQRLRKPVWIYGKTGNKCWSRAATAGDARIANEATEKSSFKGVPITEVNWGDLHRAGYHQGMTHLHHFYTPRNLVVMAALWRHAQTSPVSVREAIKFWILSYNASHSTLMTRIVAKRGQKDFSISGAQSGVLYVSGLPVEKNILHGLRRKLKVISAAFDQMRGLSGDVRIHQNSSLHVDLMDTSIDYVFTDPPFGDYIPYSEINFLNEAWLGKLTDTTEEAIVSKAQGKSLMSYQSLLAGAFAEIFRVLKKGAHATVVFHSASSAAWNSLKAAYEQAGFSVGGAGLLDKTQGSFKQVNEVNSVQGDALLMLTASAMRRDGATMEVVGEVIEFLLKNMVAAHGHEKITPKHLYTRYVNYYLSRQEGVPLGALEFYRALEAHPAYGKHLA